MPSATIPTPNAPQHEMSVAEQGIVRAAALLGLPPLLRERGIDIAEVLTQLGVDAHALDHAENRIQYYLGGRLLRHCAALTACPHFGLLVGQRNTIQSLGTLGELMLCSRTVGQALRSLILNMRQQTRGGVPTHGVDGASATLGYAIYLRDMPGAVQANDLAMAYEFNILKTLCGARWQPGEVTFAHAAPADIGPYRQLFQAPLRFNADRGEIRFDKAWLDTHLPGHDADRLRDLQRTLAQELMLAPDDHAELVRRALRAMIPGGRGSEPEIAELLSLPTRTLRRLLAVQNTTFSMLLEEVRFEIARQLLVDTSMNTAQIADSLDYADASAFTRAFRRWTDSPPATWRKRTRSAAMRQL